MKKLFIFYIGGRAQQANIEVHDVFFGVGETAEDCYPSIKAHWFGEPKGLHVDSYAAIEYVDGYEIIIAEEAPGAGKKAQAPSDPKLFFLNLGYYHPEKLAEQHNFQLIIAKDIPEAKAKAKERMKNENKISLLHTDNSFEVDDVLLPAELISPRHSIRLIPSTEEKNIRYTHGYFLID